MMRKYAALLAIAITIAFTGAKTYASPLAPTSVGTEKNSEPIAQTMPIKAIPAPASNSHSPAGDHTFQVNDVKGLLLKCIAPQIDTDPDTDIFNSCTLAPGRTLDDVMHTFIQAIHFVQDKQVKERAECDKSHAEELVLKPAQK
jgi:hypothetical protein